MKIPIYIIRNTYGQVTQAAHRADLMAEATAWKVRMVGSTKQLAAALLQSGSRQLLIDAAWRMAVKQGAVDPSRPFRSGDSFDLQSIEYGRQEATQLDYYIGLLINNPNSKFYIHG